jgi:hypothetical protein
VGEKNQHVYKVPCVAKKSEKIGGAIGQRKHPRMLRPGFESRWSHFFFTFPPSLFLTSPRRPKSYLQPSLRERSYTSPLAGNYLPAFSHGLLMYSASDAIASLQEFSLVFHGALRRPGGGFSVGRQEYYGNEFILVFSPCSIRSPLMSFVRISHQSGLAQLVWKGPLAALLSIVLQLSNSIAKPCVLGLPLAFAKPSLSI